jgi:hypothetical protein
MTWGSTGNRCHCRLTSKKEEKLLLVLGFKGQTDIIIKRDFKLKPSLAYNSGNPGILKGYIETELLWKSKKHDYNENI